MSRSPLQKFLQKLIPRKKREFGTEYADERSLVLKDHKCVSCNIELDFDKFKANQYVCYNCGHHFRISVSERLRYLVDNGEYQEFSSDITSLNPLDFPDYEEKVQKAQQKTGQKEAVKTVIAHLDGRETVIIIMSFEFMGGSMGSVVGEKISRAILLAAHRQLPCILFAASGGARMQEGIFSLMQMAKTSHAIALLEQVKMPFFVVLTDPTTGGVTASFAMLGDVTIAEPEALIGFAGPRVIEGIIKQKLPEGFQRSEFQLEKGFVDMVIERNRLKKTLVYLIDTHVPKEGGSK